MDNYTQPQLVSGVQGVLERGEESLPLERVLEIMTIEGARVVGTDKETGSIEVGKSADLIVLDRNIAEVGMEQVGGTQVLLTVFEGRIVYQQSS